MLRYSARVFHAPRVLLAWKTREKLGLEIAAWSDGEFTWTREAPGRFDPPVARELMATSFLCTEADAPPCPVLRMSSEGQRRWRGTPLDPDLQAQLDARAVLGVPLTGKTFEGHLLILDNPTMISDDLLLGEVTGRWVTAVLDHHHRSRRLRAAILAHERRRVARDLHDGVLQSLAGIALQLESVNRLLDTDPKDAKERLTALHDAVLLETGPLRGMVERLKSGFDAETVDLAAAAAPLSVSLELQQLARTIGSHWQIRIDMSVEGLDEDLPDRLRREIWFILHEGLVNAARHARASRVAARVAAHAAGIQMTITDNGRGFAFRGRHDLAALMMANVGPSTLKERIAALGGALTIESTGSGSSLEIVLPRDRA